MPDVKIWSVTPPTNLGTSIPPSPVKIIIDTDNATTISEAQNWIDNNRSFESGYTVLSEISKIGGGGGGILKPSDR